MSEEILKDKRFLLSNKLGVYHLHGICLSWWGDIVMIVPIDNTRLYHVWHRTLTYILPGNTFGRANSKCLSCKLNLCRKYQPPLVWTTGHQAHCSVLYNCDRVDFAMKMQNWFAGVCASVPLFMGYQCPKQTTSLETRHIMLVVLLS